MMAFEELNTKLSHVKLVPVAQTMRENGEQVWYDILPDGTPQRMKNPPDNSRVKKPNTGTYPPYSLQPVMKKIAMEMKIGLPVDRPKS